MKNIDSIVKEKFNINIEDFLELAEEEDIDTYSYNYQNNLENMSPQEYFDFFIKVIIPYIIKKEDSSEDAIYKIIEVLKCVL